MSTLWLLPLLVAVVALVVAVAIDARVRSARAGIVAEQDALAELAATAEALVASPRAPRRTVGAIPDSGPAGVRQ